MSSGRREDGSFVYVFKLCLAPPAPNPPDNRVLVRPHAPTGCTHLICPGETNAPPRSDCEISIWTSRHVVVVVFAWFSFFNFFCIIIFPTQQQIWNLKRLGNRTLRPSPTKLLWSEFNWREKRKGKVKKVEWAERASAGVLDHQTPWDTINMCYRCGLLCAISLAGWCQFVTPPHLLQIICWPRKRSGSYMRGSPLYGSGKDERAPLLMCGSDGDRRCV